MSLGRNASTAGDLVRVDEPVELDGSVGAAVDEVADRIGLDGRVGQVPGRAEALSDDVEVDLAGVALQMRVEEAEAALVGTRGPDEAVPHEVGRRDAGDGGPAGMEALRPRPLLEEHLHAGGGARRHALRRHDAVRVEAEELRGNHSRAEMRDEAGGVEANVMKAALDGGANADRRLHARGIGREEVAPVHLQGLR